jgi:SAM-dependent methyltransferase/uncharacterized protein YbaR (Trm112 family)
MRERLLQWTACPTCGEKLSCKTLKQERHGSEAEILEGRLTCQGCGAEYAIIRGIPRFAKTGGPEGNEAAAAQASVKQRTAAAFGHEWHEWDRLGWDRRSDEAWERAFRHKALARPSEFDECLVLDAGCGNGRYAYQAMQHGGEIVAMDLSSAVEVAYTNLKSFERVHVVQADIFHPPLRRRIFDHVFSIGVLMHTGDARAAFHSLAELVKPGGTIRVHVYSRGNRAYEAADRFLRAHTVEMDFTRLEHLAERAETIARGVYASRRFTGGRPYLYQLMNCFIRLESDRHSIFDWYAAPVATHHTYPEVTAWFREAGFEVVAHQDRAKGRLRRLLASPAAGVTVKGRLPMGARR